MDKIFMLNPVFGMLYNTSQKRWHPILFEYHPFPGPDDDRRPDGKELVRVRSKGHHTIGFDSRESALADIRSSCEKIEPCPIIDESKDIQWDGEGIPAMSALLVDKKLVFF